MSTLTQLKDSTLHLLTNTIGACDDIVTTTRNVTKAAAAGSEILLHHAEYYNDMHLQHHATKTQELTTAHDKLSDEAKALIAKFKGITTEVKPGNKPTDNG